MTVSTVAYSYGKIAANTGLAACRSALSFVKRNRIKTGLVAAAVVAPHIAPAGYCISPVLLAAWGFRAAHKIDTKTEWLYSDLEEFKGNVCFGVGSIGVVATILSVLAVAANACVFGYSGFSDQADSNVTQAIANGQKEARNCQTYSFYKSPFFSYRQVTKETCSTAQLMTTSGGYAMYRLDGNVTTVKLNSQPHP